MCKEAEELRRSVRIAEHERTETELMRRSVRMDVPASQIRRNLEGQGPVHPQLQAPVVLRPQQVDRMDLAQQQGNNPALFANTLSLDEQAQLNRLATQNMQAQAPLINQRVDPEQYSPKRCKAAAQALAEACDALQLLVDTNRDPIYYTKRGHKILNNKILAILKVYESDLDLYKSVDDVRKINKHFDVQNKGGVFRVVANRLRSSLPTTGDLAEGEAELNTELLGIQDDYSFLISYARRKKYENTINKKSKALIEEKNDSLLKDEETLPDNFDEGLSSEVIAGIHEIDRWIIRNMNKTGIKAFSNNDAAMDGAMTFLRKTAREKLLVYYLIENKRRHDPNMGDIMLSQKDYVPNLDKFKNQMVNTKWKIWERVTGAHLRWDKISESAQFEKNAKSQLRIVVASQKAQAKKAENPVRVGVAQLAPEDNYYSDEQIATVADSFVAQIEDTRVDKAVLKGMAEEYLKKSRELEQQRDRDYEAFIRQVESFGRELKKQEDSPAYLRSTKKKYLESRTRISDSVDEAWRELVASDNALARHVDPRSKENVAIKSPKGKAGQIAPDAFFSYIGDFSKYIIKLGGSTVADTISLPTKGVAMPFGVGNLNLEALNFAGGALSSAASVVSFVTSIKYFVNLIDDSKSTWDQNNGVENFKAFTGALGGIFSSVSSVGTTISGWADLAETVEKMSKAAEGANWDKAMSYSDAITKTWGEGVSTASKSLQVLGGLGILINTGIAITECVQTDSRRKSINKAEHSMDKHESVERLQDKKARGQALSNAEKIELREAHFDTDMLALAREKNDKLRSKAAIDTVNAAISAVTFKGAGLAVMFPPLAAIGLVATTTMTVTSLIMTCVQYRTKRKDAIDRFLQLDKQTEAAYDEYMSELQRRDAVSHRRISGDEKEIEKLKESLREATKKDLLASMGYLDYDSFYSYIAGEYGKYLHDKVFKYNGRVVKQRDYEDRLAGRRPTNFEDYDPNYVELAKGFGLNIEFPTTAGGSGVPAAGVFAAKMI